MLHHPPPQAPLAPRLARDGRCGRLCGQCVCATVHGDHDGLVDGRLHGRDRVAAVVGRGSSCRRGTYARHGHDLGGEDGLPDLGHVRGTGAAGKYGIARCVAGTEAGDGSSTAGNWGAADNGSTADNRSSTAGGSSALRSARPVEPAKAATVAGRRGGRSSSNGSGRRAFSSGGRQRSTGSWGGKNRGVGISSNAVLCAIVTTVAAALTV